jgi:hypothetical protein
LTRAALAVFATCLALAAPAAATLPKYPSGSSIGEGVPLKAYATISPQVHLFGDVVTARLAIVADSKLVDASRLNVSTDFHPYRPIHRPTVQELQVGRFSQTTWTWNLRCTTTDCVPLVPPSERFHIFRFQTIHIDYLTPQGKRSYGIDATWPKVEVFSQITPGVLEFLRQTKHLNWRFQITPVALPTYRLSPALLFWLALGAGVAVLFGAAFLAWRWYRVVRPPRIREPGAAPGSTLERALAVLAWAHARGDETLERKALERVAGELQVDTPIPEADELSRTARELAWSARTPEDADVETFSERARGTGRPPKTED